MLLYEHIENGLLYIKISECLFKCPDTLEWIQGILYMADADKSKPRKLYTRSKASFDARFRPIIFTRDKKGKING